MDHDALVAAAKIRATPETIAAVRALYEQTSEPLRKVATETGVPYGSIIVLARANRWKKRRTNAGDAIKREPELLIPFTEARLAELKIQYEGGTVRLIDLSNDFGIIPQTLARIARKFQWKRNGHARLAPMQGTAAQPRPHPKMQHAPVDARKYDKPTMAAILCLQRAGWIVYQTKPGEFMVGTKRMDHAGMMAKAERYGAGRQV